MALGARPAVGMAFQSSISAMGGGGGDKDTPVDNTRRLKMVPVERELTPTVGCESAPTL